MLMMIDCLFRRCYFTAHVNAIRFDVYFFTYYALLLIFIILLRRH